VELSRLPRRRRGPLACGSPRRHEPGGPRPLPFKTLARRFAALLLAVALQGDGQATEVNQGKAAPGGETSPETRKGLRVEFSGGLLSVEADDVVLQELLEEVAHQSGLVLSFREAATGRVTSSFDDVELPAAIARLLHGSSYALQYAPGDPGTSARRLWLFTSGGSPEGVQTVIEGSVTARGAPLDDAAAMRLESVAALAEQETDPFAFALASAIVDASPAVRYEAVYALGEIGGEVSPRLLQQALLDADADIRAAAVDALAEVGGEQSANVLANVLSDPDPALRENAVYALGEIGGERAADLLRQASTDPDEFVREAAADMLREVGDEG